MLYEQLNVQRPKVYIFVLGKCQLSSLWYFLSQSNFSPCPRERYFSLFKNLSRKSSKTVQTYCCFRTILCSLSINSLNYIFIIFTSFDLLHRWLGSDTQIQLVCQPLITEYLIHWPILLIQNRCRCFSFHLVLLILCYVGIWWKCWKFLSLVLNTTVMWRSWSDYQIASFVIRHLLKLDPWLRLLLFLMDSSHLEALTI